jgi:flagellar protein FliJ
MMVARDALDLLLRLRLAAEDEAKRSFAARLAEEAAARRREEAVQAEMAQERDIATDINQDDGAVEAYVAWLPIGRKRAHAARAAHEHAATNVSLARAALTLAHAAAEAAKTLIQHRAEAAATRAARQSQAALDEIASGPAQSPPQP